MQSGLLTSTTYVHYAKRTSAYEDLEAFYRGAAEQVREFCKANGIDCHIKEGTVD